MSTMNVHPVYIARQQQAGRQLRLPRNRNRSIPEILNAVARRPDTEDNGLNPDTAWRLGIVTDGQLRNPDTGARTGQLITDLPATEVAQLLDTQDPSIEDQVHLTLATSCHQTVDHNRSATPTLVRRMEETARRTIWTGTPYIPAARWEFKDGSALVQYASHIMPAVHASRLDAIQEEYLAEAEASRRRIIARLNLQPRREQVLPMVPSAGFAPAQDGIYSHQAALPTGSTRCWCRYGHEAYSDEKINAIRPR